MTPARKKIAEVRERMFSPNTEGEEMRKKCERCDAAAEHLTAVTKERDQLRAELNEAKLTISGKTFSGEDRFLRAVKKRLKACQDAEADGASWYSVEEFLRMRLLPEDAELAAHAVSDIARMLVIIGNLEKLLTTTNVSFNKLMSERDMLSGELAKAVSYLEEGKRLFAPGTTNSLVDEFIAKHSVGAK